MPEDYEHSDVSFYRTGRQIFELCLSNSLRERPETVHCSMSNQLFGWCTLVGTVLTVAKDRANNHPTTTALPAVLRYRMFIECSTKEHTLCY